MFFIEYSSMVVSSSCWAYSYSVNAAIALIDSEHWGAGTELVVHTPDGARDAVVKDKFWCRT